MKRLESGFQLVVKSGFIYLPLLLDPDIAREARCRVDSRPGSIPGTTAVIELEGTPFIKSLNIRSVVENYDRIDKDAYGSLRRAVLPKSEDDPNLKFIASEGKLRTILLKIMPHFIRKNKGSERRRFEDEDILDLVCTHIDIPRRLLDQAEQYLDPGPLWKALDELGAKPPGEEPPPEGLVSGYMLRKWILRALERQILQRERSRLEREAHRRAQLSAIHKRHIAALLALAERGSFELDGFGFSRIGPRDDYFIYKRTGEFILQDYYAQSYRFPDCRVAVSTLGALRPLVMDRYKHPFLSGHAPRQEICMTGREWPAEFTADHVIRALEDGINALLFGYDPRRRNGYHSLDPTLCYIETIEFTDYRM